MQAADHGLAVTHGRIDSDTSKLAHHRDDTGFAHGGQEHDFKGALPMASCENRTRVDAAPATS